MAILFGSMAALPAEASAVPAPTPPVAIDAPSSSETQNQTRMRGDSAVRVTPLSASDVTETRTTPPAVRETEAVTPRRRPGQTDRPAAQCVALSRIAGVRVASSRRLMLYMRDSRVMLAGFDRSCPVQGFYSGFYVTRTDDGLLCEGRDTLHARTGVNCEVRSLEEAAPPPTRKTPAKP